MDQPARRRPADDLRPPYLTMLALGAVSLLLVLFGLGNLLLTTMPWNHTGLHASVTGVYKYDPRTHSLGDTRISSIGHGQPFAARVAWSQLPAGLQVGARWYDPQDTDSGGAPPQAASQQAAHDAIVPIAGTRGPPGEYQLLVMRYADGRPAEVLGRARIRVRD
jgi:hypothetical protein